MTRPRIFGLLCMTVTLIGMVSPGKAPCFSSSVVAVMACDAVEVVLLRQSLSFLLGTEVESIVLTIWKLLVLVELRLAVVSSLGAGLFGGGVSGTCRLL